MAPARRRYADAPPLFEDAGPSRRGPVLVVVFIVLAAFGGFVWNIYGGSSAPRITPPAAAYKVAPAPDAADAPDPVEQNALFATLEGRAEAPAVTARPAPEAPLQEGAAPPFTPPRLGPAPDFADQGPFLAQLAALQSEPAVEAAWTRLASRAPALFAEARLDVERADLGQRGIYYRVRAGYFADRANAAQFCDRIKQLGQDCIVVAR